MRKPAHPHWPLFNFIWALILAGSIVYGSPRMQFFALFLILLELGVIGNRVMEIERYTEKVDS